MDYTDEKFEYLERLVHEDIDLARKYYKDYVEMINSEDEDVIIVGMYAILLEFKDDTSFVYTKVMNIIKDSNNEYLQSVALSNLSIPFADSRNKEVMSFYVSVIKNDSYSNKIKVEALSNLLIVYGLLKGDVAKVTFGNEITLKEMYSEFPGYVENIKRYLKIESSQWEL